MTPRLLSAVRELDADETDLLSLELGRPITGRAFEFYAVPALEERP